MSIKSKVSSFLHLVKSLSDTEAYTSTHSWKPCSDSKFPTVHTDLVMEKLTRTSNRLTLFIVSTYDAHKSPYVSEPCSLRNKTRYLRNHVSYNYSMQQINGKWSAFYCICNSGMNLNTNKESKRAILI